MIKLRKLVAVVCAVLVSGCAGAPPLKRFEGDRQESPIHGLSVAVVTPRYLTLSFNDKPLKEMVKSQNGMANAGPSAMSGLRLFMQSVYDPEKLYRSMTGVYYQNFKSVTLIESVNDPRIAQADMIAIPEVSFAVYPPNIGMVILACELTLFLACLLPWTTKTVTMVTTAFYSPDHSLIATIKSAPFKANRRKMPLADSKLDEYIFPNAIVGVANSLDRVFQESPELKQYANGLRTKAGVQAQAAPAESRPAAKLISSDVDAAGYHFSENPLNYAVVVGVESYANLPTAAFAKRDAEAIRAHLRALGYPGQNIALLTDSQATGSKLKSYIESWLPRNVKPDSRVFVYFAGHGAPDTESKQAYLLLWDGDAQFISDTGYPLKRLYEKLNELNAKEVVLAMDSSFSGAGGRSVLAKGARPLMGRTDADLTVGKLTVLTATAGDEITGDAQSEGHGLFTYHLLKSLNELSGSGSVAEAHARFSPLVQDAARKNNQSQTPQLLGANASKAALR